MNILAALLPGDVIVRYHRKKGDEVIYVSGVIIMERLSL